METPIISTHTSTVDSRILADRLIASPIRINWELVAWVVLLIFAVISRFYMLDARVISHDESLHTYYSWLLYDRGEYQHNPMMHGPVQFHLLALSYTLFGDSDFSAHAPAAIFGVATVLLCWFFRPHIGKLGAFLAGLMMTISPYLLYYSRYVRNESFVAFFGVLMALAVANYYKERKPIWLYVLAGSVAFQYGIKETSFIYVAIWLLFAGFLFVRDTLTVRWQNNTFRAGFITLVSIGLGLAFIALLMVEIESLTHVFSNNASATAETTVPNTFNEDSKLDLPAPILAVGGLGVLALVVAAGLVVWDLKYRLRTFPSVDIMVILLTTLLPQIAAFPAKQIFKANPLDYTGGQNLTITGINLAVIFLISAALGLFWNWRLWLVANAVFWGIFAFFYTTMFTNGVGFFSGTVGSLGYWLDQQEVKRGGQPWYYYLLINMPVYEYLPTLGMLLAATLGILPAWKWLTVELPGYFKRHAEYAGEANTKTEMALETAENQAVNYFPLPFFLLFWSVMAIFAFSFAGEKMPWLTVHITLPMILLSGWAFAILLKRIRWANLLQSQWGMLLLIPLNLFSLTRLLGAVLASTTRPFQGTETAQLNATTNFIFSLLFFVATAYVLYLRIRKDGFRMVADTVGAVVFALLVILTARTAYYANYINFDNQTEFINYASGGPGNRYIMDQVEEISIRTTGGLDLKVAYDDASSWPMTWYMRNYKNAVFYGGAPSRTNLDGVQVIMAGNKNWQAVEAITRDDYYQFEYIRMWWPMQDYWNMKSFADVIEGMPLAPGTCRPQDSAYYSNLANQNSTTVQEEIAKDRDARKLRENCAKIWGGIWSNAEYRQALWDIWWNRDYTQYGELTSTDFSLTNWPVSDRIRLYIHRDLAAKMWSLGVGPQALTEPPQPDPFDLNFKADYGSSMSFGAGAFSSNDSLANPRAVAVDAQGNVYVANSGKHNVVVFNAQGELVQTLGRSDMQLGAEKGEFNEPWGVALDADGNLYVSDTWNHRVQKFSPKGEFLASWGVFSNDPTSSPLNLWGPRGIAVNPVTNHVYVADTGNKRIAVFDTNGEPLFSIGQGGAEGGRFEEPVGLAFDADGNLYVADTWNRRIQVLSADGTFLREWEVPGWESDTLNNKPYLAVDSTNQRVYFSDPEGYRIYVTDLSGVPQFSFGTFGQSASTELNLPFGVAVDAEGNVYVSDSANNRVQKFPLMK
ncbi:MAG TPA: TIGR03663 family protein [Anaerolineales bacterium]|nr:TIGR03663 family protein [Anaerolineales bacterium]